MYIYFCVWLNPALKLQHTLQVKPKENENTCKMFKNKDNLLVYLLVSLQQIQIVHCKVAETTYEGL